MFSLVSALVLTATTTLESPATAPLGPNPELVASMPLSLPAPPAEGGGADLSYTYLEAGFTTYNVHDLNDDNVDTYYARASLGLLKFLYVFGA